MIAPDAPHRRVLRGLRLAGRALTIWGWLALFGSVGLVVPVAYFVLVRISR